MYHDKELTIRPITEQDLPRLWELIFKDEKPEWKKWDAPYFPHHTKSYEEFVLEQVKWVNNPNYWIIEVEDIVRGIISY